MVSNVVERNVSIKVKKLFDLVALIKHDIDQEAALDTWAESGI